MYNTIPDLYRKSSIENIFKTPTFKKCWPIWQPEIHRLLGENYTENEIINLGDHLTSIFQTTGAAGREQAELSAGGTAWESLVCWYINLCTVGSRIVAIKKMSLVPAPIQHAITVNYGNFPCNTESDITVIVFPNLPDYNANIVDLNVHDNNQPIPSFKKGKFNFHLANFLTSRDFNEFEIGIIQCKTNWNDNAQVPMLWDMIYSANGFRGHNITIGREGYNIHTASNFTYSFVTVPSNKKTVFKSDSVSVKRVTHLSGGNYWGKPTTQNVARSLKEIFTSNYPTGFRNNVRNDIRDALPELHANGALSYFGL